MSTVLKRVPLLIHSSVLFSNSSSSSSSSCIKNTLINYPKKPRILFLLLLLLLLLLANRDDKNDDEEEDEGKNTTRFHHAKASTKRTLGVFELEQRNELLGKQAKSWQEKCARTSEREREAQREARFTRELNAKMTNDLIESEASRMRLRAEVDRLLTNGKRKEKYKY